jgi:CRP-like cAMP-binding protein
MSDELFIDTQGVDDLEGVAPARRSRTNSAGTPRHIGCPMDWLKWVYPVVRSKAELLVALYIYRLRSIQRSRTVKVSNTRLAAELGINRFAKYRALKRLADAGIITVEHKPHSSLEIVFHK